MVCWDFKSRSLLETIHGLVITAIWKANWGESPSSNKISAIKLLYWEWGLNLIRLINIIAGCVFVCKIKTLTFCEKKVALNECEWSTRREEKLSQNSEKWLLVSISVVWDCLVLPTAGQGWQSWPTVYCVLSEHSWRKMGKQDKPALIWISTVVS